MNSISINRVNLDISKYNSNNNSNEINTGVSCSEKNKVIVIKRDDKNNVIKNEKNLEKVFLNKNERNQVLYESKPKYDIGIKPKIEDKVISLRNRFEYKANYKYKEIKDFKKIEKDSKTNKKMHNTTYQIKTHPLSNKDKSEITLNDRGKTEKIIYSKNNKKDKSQEGNNKNKENRDKASIYIRTIASANNEKRIKLPGSNTSNTHIDNNEIKKLKDINPKIAETNKIKITDPNKEQVDKLRNVKSNYIFKLIFSFLEEKEKLNILKYNKLYQKQCSKTIDDYKNISGRYKKDGINGLGAEYLLNKKILIFKGEYLNGKRSGYGREFENHKMIFEGNYLNGKRNGQGKEYIDRELIFEGNYLNGKRNGQGKEYIDRELIFEGYYLNGKRNGYGREYIDRVLIFEGNYLNGKRNGKGKKYYNDGGLKFEGIYLDGNKWNGKMFGKNCKEVSELKNGKGRITKYYENGELKFEGEYLNGKKNGKGKEYEFNEELFDGEYLNGKRWNGKKYYYNWDLINIFKMHGYGGYEPVSYFIEYLDGKEQINNK